MTEHAAAAAPRTLQITASERRSGERHRSVLLIGRLCGATQAACVIHNLSSGGLMGRFETAPAIGERLRIELRGLDAVEGTVRWVRGHKAGIEFDTKQKLDSVFSLRQEDGRTARPPRFPLSTPARLILPGGAFDASVLDISAGGAKLAIEGHVTAGDTGQLLLIESGTAMFGTAAWCVSDRIGFRFAAPLTLNALATLLGEKRPAV